jgi:hypothetical protein
LKVLIITPDGDKLEFISDYWEFSQNKFENQDIVLHFYKEEELKDTGITETKFMEKVEKPSKTGILLQSMEVSDLLVNVVDPDKLKLLRKDIIFIDSFVPFKGFSSKLIKTDAYSVNEYKIENALSEFISKEKEVCKDYQIQIIKEASVIFAKDDNFYIEEEVLLGRTE